MFVENQMKRQRWILILTIALTATLVLSPSLLKSHRATAQIVDVMVHPLDPLKAEEIDEAVTILKASKKIPDGCLFPTVALHEPNKEDILKFRAGDPFTREAYIVAFD